jgi:hypothetical protein
MLVDGGDQAHGLFELVHGFLDLLVEDAAVGDDDDRVEDAPVGGIVQTRELVGEPGNGKALAAAGAVLDEVTLARALGAGMGNEAAHGVDLVVAGEDELSFLAPFVVRFVEGVHEVPDEVEEAVRRPYLVPEVTGGKAERVGRVAGAGAVALVKGKEARSAAVQFGGEGGEVGVDGEVGEDAAEGEERLAAGIAVVAVLALGVLDSLPFEGLLELGREEGQPVEEEDDVEAFFGVGAVAQLAHDGEAVALDFLLVGRVEASFGDEVGHVEAAAAVAQAVAQEGDGAFALDLALQALQEAALGLLSQLVDVPGPHFGLGAHDEVEDVCGNEAAGAVVGGVGAFLVTVGQQRLFDGRFEIPF